DGRQRGEVTGEEEVGGVVRQVDAGRGERGFDSRAGTGLCRPPSAGPDVRGADTCSADVRGAGGRVLSEVAVEDEVEAEGSGLPVGGGESVAALAEMALALLGVREPQSGPQSRKDLVELGQQLGPGEVDPTVGRGEVLDSGDDHLVIRDAHQAHHSTLPIDHSRSPSQFRLCLAYPKRYRTEGVRL